MNPLKVLIIEDDEEDYFLISHVFRQIQYFSCELIWHSNYDQARQAIEEGDYDILFLDYQLGSKNGLDLLKETKDSPWHPPAVLLTGHSEYDLDSAALEAGVVDYLNKANLDPIVLTRSIRYALKQKTTELELISSRTFLRSALDALSTHIAILNPQGHIIAANNAWLDFASLAGHDLSIGTNYLSFCRSPESFYPEGLPIAKQLEDVSTGRLPSLQVEYECCEGASKRGLLMCATPLDPRHIKTSGSSPIVISHTDITERNIASAALLAAEARTRFALENAKVGIWEFDYSTGVCTWSETLEKMHELKPGTFEQTFEAFVESIHPDDRESALAVVTPAIESGRDFSFLSRANLPDGEVRWLEGSGRFLLNEQGVPLRGLGISIDVTEKLALASQLQQSQKMEAVGQLAGGIAHDFNNILTVITASCDFIAAELPSNHKSQADLVEITKAAQSATVMTRQLLAFSRKQPLQSEILDLCHVLTDNQEFLTRLLPSTHQLRCHLPVTPSYVRADQGLIQQVLMNLVVNARDASQGGPIDISLTVRDLSEPLLTSQGRLDPGPYALITVKDQGSGMSPEVLSRIFEPFFTTKEISRGTGLGLSTVYGIVEQSHGSLNVSSTVGHGTTFEIYLPALKGQEILSAELSALASPKALNKDTHVLIVEDEKPLRLLAERILTSHGFKVSSAASGPEALAFCQTNSPDVAIIDIIMPGQNGALVADEMSRLCPSTRIVLMSGYAQADIQEDLLSRWHFLAKPFNAAALVEAVGRAHLGTPLP